MKAWWQVRLPALFTFCARVLWNILGDIWTCYSLLYVNRTPGFSGIEPVHSGLYQLQLFPSIAGMHTGTKRKESRRQGMSSYTLLLPIGSPYIYYHWWCVKTAIANLHIYINTVWLNAGNRHSVIINCWMFGAWWLRLTHLAWLSGL